MRPAYVVKRDGRKVPFDIARIEAAIEKAARAVDVSLNPQAVAQAVVRLLSSRSSSDTVAVEEIQDTVEEVLMDLHYPVVARAYIAYRQHRAQARRIKKFLGVEDDLKLSVNAAVVLQKRYLMKDENGQVIETPSGMFARVARAISTVDRLYGDPDSDEMEERYYTLMTSLDFLPNSPTLMNAGTENGQLSACFVIPVEDSLESIFDAVKAMALIQQSGGGTGFSFSRLRPHGDIVRSTHGIASGPVSFMKVFDVTTDVIKQGGKRRGANMGILSCTHPDILEFITAKHDEGAFSNFNISVAATDAFVEAAIQGASYELINPRTGQAVREINARDVFDLIVSSAWRSGDPGLVFIDEINRHNPTPEEGVIESTNPCGEQPLLPFESCNLGSINLSRFVRNGSIDFDRLREVVRVAIRFLDNVIDANVYPLPQIAEITRRNRKVGLGVMGFAEMLIRLGIPYDSPEALDIARTVSSFLTEEARKASAELAAKRGPFPNYERSLWRRRGYPPLRNATVTTIAPTGSISIIAGTSSGIEPLFAISFFRNVLEGTRLLEVNPLFEDVAIKRNFYSEELMLEIAATGTVTGIAAVPDDVKRVFRTALEISPEYHVRMQAAFQENVDNAVSKTVNLPEHSTPEDVRSVFLLAYKLKCKGITVYRYGTKEGQVLTIGGAKDAVKNVSADVEYSGGCPLDTCLF
jgi:ribonucleoside-diphosphate reductase alpha chain